MYAMQGLTSLEAIAIWVVFGIAIVGLLYAVFLRSQILKEDKGTAQDAGSLGSDQGWRRRLSA